MVLNTTDKYSTSTWLFCMMWFIIGFVSSYDVYLSIIHGDVLYDIEQNPMAKYIIASQGLAAFLSFKMLGTISALGIIILLYHNYRKISWAVNIAIFTAQMLLFIYLTLYVC